MDVVGENGLKRVHFPLKSTPRCGLCVCLLYPIEQGVESTPLTVFPSPLLQISIDHLSLIFCYRLKAKSITRQKGRVITLVGSAWHIFHCYHTEFSVFTFSCFWHLYSVLISVFGWKNIVLVIFSSKHWNLENLLLTSASLKKYRIFDNFTGFRNPEFDNFMTQLAILLWKYNEQHSSISKNQIKVPATFS